MKNLTTILIFFFSDWTIFGAILWMHTKINPGIKLALIKKNMACFIFHMLIFGPAGWFSLIFDKSWREK